MLWHNPAAMPNTLPAPKHSFLRNLNLVRSVVAHTTFYSALVIGLFTTASPVFGPLMLTAVALWAAGLPLRAELAERADNRLQAAPATTGLEPALGLN